MGGSWEGYGRDMGGIGTISPMLNLLCTKAFPEIMGEMSDFSEKDALHSKYILYPIQSLHEATALRCLLPMLRTQKESLFTVIFESVFHLENKLVTIHFNIPEIDNVIKWFNDNRSWGTLWRYVVTFLTGILMIIPLIMVAFLFGNDDRKDVIIKAGPWLLAIVILLIAVMLSVTYRISRTKESNHLRAN